MKIENLEKMCNYLRVVKGAVEVNMLDISRDTIWYKTSHEKTVRRSVLSVFQEMKELGIDI